MVMKRKEKVEECLIGGQKWLNGLHHIWTIGPSRKRPFPCGSWPFQQFFLGFYVQMAAQPWMLRATIPFHSFTSPAHKYVLQTFNVFLFCFSADFSSKEGGCLLFYFQRREFEWNLCELIGQHQNNTYYWIYIWGICLIKNNILIKYLSPLILIQFCLFNIYFNSTTFRFPLN